MAIAAAIDADRCDIYTDVDGVYTTDPRIEPKARRLDRIAFEEMLEMASLGAKVLQVRSVEMAMVHGVKTFVRSSFEDPDAIDSSPGASPPGTLICDEDDIVEQEVVTGIAYARDEAQISLRRVPDKPGVSASIFGPLTYGLANWLSGGDHRQAILFTGAYFVVGLLLLAGIDMVRGRRSALRSGSAAAGR